MGYLQIKNEPEGTAGICMVDACYVTGAITGDGSIGGLIGGTSNSNAEVTVKNNLSLITAIDGSSAVGRIFGNRSSEATLSDNYAYRSMKVNGDLISTGDENYGATKFHGANVTAKQLQDFATAENAALNKFATDDTWNYTPGELPVLENVANKAEQDRDLPFRYVEYFKKENGVFTALEEDEDWTAGTQYSVKTGEDLGVELYEEEGKTYWYDRLGGQMVLAPDALSDAEFKNHELYARIGSGEIEQYTLSFEVDGGTDIESITADKDTEFDLADYQTDKDGHTFAGWHTDADHAEEVKTITLTQDTTVYAKWNKTEDGGGSGGGSTKRYTLTFAVNGGNTLPSVRKSSGTKLDLANYKTAKEGYTFLGWYADADLTEEVKTVVLRKDTTVYAKWTDDGTELREHKAYLFGFGDGTVRPDAAISRAEVAQILYRISGEKDTHMASYSDVKSGAWYYDAVSSMTDQGIITGYPDGSFRPDSAISRAEFSTLIAKYNELDISEMATFPDVSASHWASRFIAAAQENGYVYGYSDGTFRPENSITRGEVASIINKMLGMVCDADSFANVQSDLKMFTDNRDTSKWHYYEMITATNSCTYRLDGKRHPVWVSVK